MKKLAVALFVALLGFAFTAPAFAIEHQFGGYWRVRMFNNTNFDGDDDDRNVANQKEELQKADTRTRLYYTAVLNDNLKFVNKFEMDANWGESSSYGDIGADAKTFEIKNSYIDFNLNGANVKLGTQGAVIQRGFIFDDDFSGIVFSMDGFTALYAKVDETGDSVGDDAQLYHAKYAFGGNGFTITPSLTYVDGDKDDVERKITAQGVTAKYFLDKAWFLGLDIDGAAGDFGYWATFIYEGGKVRAGGDSADLDAFLIALGGEYTISDAASIHFEGFYATGQDDDDDAEIFTVPAGQSYYWSEIMGLGIFDDQASNGSCGDKIGNVMAINLGISYNATDKLKLGADVWYARLAEDDVNGDDYLGTEVDLSAKYTIVEGLTMDVVAAYLFAGDATNGTASDDANPFEIGTRFSISF